MKILVITQLYPQPDDYGDNKPTKTVEYFAKEWVRKGHEVVVAHCSSKFPLPFYFIPPPIKNKLAGKTSNIFPPLSSRKKIVREKFGIKIYRYPMLKALPGKGYSPNVMLRQSRKIIHDLEIIDFLPDLVVGHFANPSTELVSLVAKHYNCKSSIVFHGDCNEKTIEKYRLKSLVSTIGAVGARSEIEAYKIQKLLALEKRPFVCCSGVPNEALMQAASICDKHNCKNGLKFLYVGSFIKRKHVETVIEAFDKIATANDILTIVGGGPEEEKLKELVCQKKSKEQIVFTGRVDRDKVLRYMKESNILTLVSDGEVFGMVYIEAMLQGCLTIASKGGGFDGIIKHKKNGYICKPGDSVDLASIYKEIQNSQCDELNQIGQNAIDTAMHYSEQEVADVYLNNILMRN